jgi:hypothetical protein
MEAGIGRAVITPELPVMLAGFGDRTVPATELHDDLEVRAVCFSAGGAGVGGGGGRGRVERITVCLLVCDLNWLPATACRSTCSSGPSVARAS